MSRTPPGQGRLIYHLTSLDNWESIREQRGLLSRRGLEEKGLGFKDIADPEIIRAREQLGILDSVPFHFFAKNPFDGRVMKEAPPHHQFVLIAVARTTAERLGYRIITSHPLNFRDQGLQPLDYQKGIQAIDWDLMARRDYTKHDCKQVCMAECLAPGFVSANDWELIFTETPDVRDLICGTLEKKDHAKVKLNPQMFASRLWDAD